MQIRPKADQLQSADETGHVMRMHTDICGGKGWPSVLGIDPPSAALVLGEYRRNGPVLRELDVNLANVPELASTYHLTRLPDHGKGRETVSNPENHSGSALPFDEIESIEKIGSERLVANDVKTPLQKSVANVIVARIGCRYGHGIYSVGPLRLPLRHFLVARVGTLARQIPLRGSIACSLRI